MQWLEKLSKPQQIALVLFLFALWCGASWRWYTCGIKGFCELSGTPETQEVVLSPVMQENCPALITAELRIGARNDAGEVRKLEWFLRTMGGATIAQDGMFGPNDAAALKKYQESRLSLGLTPNGILDAETRALISSDACAASLARN